MIKLGLKEDVYVTLLYFGVTEGYATYRLWIVALFTVVAEIWVIIVIITHIK